MAGKYTTHYDFVFKNEQGMAEYIDSPTELDDDTLIAKVKVVCVDGKEASRDAFVSDDAWITVRDFYKR